MAKKKEDHSKEIFEQIMGEAIESMNSKKFKIYNFVGKVFAWALLIALALGIYRLLEWLITM